MCFHNMTGVRFAPKHDPDKNLKYRALLDRHNYTCISDTLSGVYWGNQVSREKVSYLKEVAVKLEARKKGLPPGVWDRYGPLDYNGCEPYEYEIYSRKMKNR